MIQTTPQDVLAAMDVLEDIGEHSDAMDAETAVAFRAACEELRKKVLMTISLINVQLHQLLEGQPRQFNGKIYSVVKDGKWRPTQEAIRKAVVTAAATDDEGNVTAATAEAAARAYDLAVALFVAPTTVPKVTGLKQLGLTMKDVAQWAHTGKKVEVTNVEGPADDA